MSPRLKAVGVDKMTVQERLQLIREIEDTIPAPNDVPLTDAQKADLDRRLEWMRENPNAGSSVEEVMARLRAAKD